MAVPGKGGVDGAWSAVGGNVGTGGTTVVVAPGKGVGRAGTAAVAVVGERS